MMTDREPIAVIGVGCRFPGSPTPETFWENLRNGIDAVTEVPDDRPELAPLKTVPLEAPDDHSYRWGGFLEGIDRFDPKFFGIHPQEAPSLDPKQRLFLEVAWEALEDAGQIPERLAGSPVGVFVGVSSVDYYALLMNQPEQVDGYTVPNNSNCIIANRLSYTLDLTGPSLAIDTACSSSLVAVHLACQSLRMGECCLAIVGGVNVNLLPGVWLGLSRGGMISPNGRCRSFDASANGYARSEGAGVLILKPLSRAIAEGDRVYASIRASATNQNGRGQRLTAPNPKAQETLLRQVYARAGISPSRVQYIEANGTGTVLGDYMELKALGEFFSSEDSSMPPRAVGTVKTNIGHAEGASGMAGLIKLILSLWHRQIPPSLHFREPNPHVRFDRLPLAIHTHLTEWPESEEPAIAGINSFGFGGTNAHLVIEERPARLSAPSPSERPLEILTLGAKTEAALRELALCYHEFLSAHPELSLADVCFSANTGRSPFDHRLAIVADSLEQLGDRLHLFATGQPGQGIIHGKINRRRPAKVAFWFPSQENPRVGTGDNLYRTQSTFRSALAHCERILLPYLEKPLLSLLYPEDDREAPDTFPRYTPVLSFALEYALAEVWKSWGIVAEASLGYGIGEAIAACLTGTVSLETILPAIATGEYQETPRTGRAEKLAELAGTECDLYLEIGRHWEFPATDPKLPGTWLSSWQDACSEWESLLLCLAHLHTRGIGIDWSAFEGDRPRQRLSLPTYPFQRQRYWIETEEVKGDFARPVEDSVCRTLSTSPGQELEEMYVAPRDRWEAELIEIWENTLHLRPIGIHNNFFELGGDSKLIASLLVAIEKTYGRQFPLALLYEAPTIEQLAAILRQENWSVPRKSLVPIQPNGSRPPLFGIHVLGKGLKTYRSLLPYLGAEQPVYGLHYRLGVVPTERYTEALTTVPDLAAHYIQEMQLLQPKGPYHLCGHSFGGFVAFEMARQLQDCGERVALLILFDTIVPDSFKRLSLAQRILQHWQSVRHSGTNYITQKIRGKAYQLIRKSKQSSSHRNTLLLEKPAPAIVVRADADDPGLQMLSDHTQMAEKYLQELPTYSGKVTFFQALEQPLGQGWYIEEKFGWGKFAVGEWESHLISGNHKTMFHEPHVQKLGETLKSCLDNLP